jgi:biotin transport system substrate-specific component
MSRDILWTVSFSLLTAVLAQIRIPLPLSPVPLTGQTFGVLLSGAGLGMRRGFASQALYLAAGAVGLPAFAGGAAGIAHLLGPTGGYLWAFPVAAGLLGRLVELGASRRVWTLALALFGADLLILISGTVWLRGLLRVPLQDQWRLGFFPFLAGDIVKIALLGLSLPRLLRRTHTSTA